MIDIFIDSGAFSAWTKGAEINIDEYIAFIKKYRNYISLYANLDVIGDAEASLKNQEYMEAKGLKPIPCFHQGEDLKYLKHYLKKYDYMALGGMVGSSTSKLVMWLDDIFQSHICNDKGLPKIKVHGFGITSLSLMLRYPWYSVDSTSWVMTGRFGGIFVPKKLNGKYNYGLNPYKVNISDKSGSIKEAGKHFNTYSKMEQEEILSYLKKKKYVLGVGEEGQPDYISGVSNDYKKRDEVNIHYFNDLQIYLPEWPWALKLDKPKGLGLI
jgi:hypothetical protein